MLQHLHLTSPKEAIILIPNIIKTTNVTRIQHHRNKLWNCYKSIFSKQSYYGTLIISIPNSRFNKCIKNHNLVHGSWNYICAPCISRASIATLRWESQKAQAASSRENQGSVNVTPNMCRIVYMPTSPTPRKILFWSHYPCLSHVKHHDFSFIREWHFPWHWFK